MSKNRYRVGSLGATFFLVFLFLSSAALADEADRRPVWELGAEMMLSGYEETGAGDAEIMSLDGLMAGLWGAYAHRSPGDNLVLKGEFQIAFGGVDYQSRDTGSISDIHQYLIELRGIAGHDFYFHDSVLITAYAGFGVRYLTNDSSGMTSTTGHGGYERESRYYYSPIGIEASAEMENGWSLGFVAEYDIFWSGEQRSHVAAFYPDLGVAENEQNSGYGLRASVKIDHKESLPFTIEPFIRYWNIDKSDEIPFMDGNIAKIFFEPKNETTEIGIKMTIRF